MSADPQKLPFVPPVEGCQVEHIHHVGPFITRVEFRLPDGTPWVWTSRQHRYRGEVRALPEEAVGRASRARWWMKVRQVVRITWWISLLFIIGSTCFAVASFAGLAPDLLGTFAGNTLALNLTFFIGSIFFTLAAYLQFLSLIHI